MSLASQATKRNSLFQLEVVRERKEGRNEVFYITTHSTRNSLFLLEVVGERRKDGRKCFI